MHQRLDLVEKTFIALEVFNKMVGAKDTKP